MKALFLSVIIILAVAGAGSVWVWQKGEDTTPLPIVNNGQENGTPDTHTDAEVIEPRINPETGWKIFEHPDVPITFEYPGEMKVIGINFFDDEHHLPGSSIVLKSADYGMSIDFALPTAEGGYAWGFARTIERMRLISHGKTYELDINQDYTPPEFYLVGTSLPRPFVGHISCTRNNKECSSAETLSLFRQFASSIKILPE